MIYSPPEKCQGLSCKRFFILLHFPFKLTGLAGQFSQKEIALILYCCLNRSLCLLSSSGSARIWLVLALGIQQMSRTRYADKYIPGVIIDYEVRSLRELWQLESLDEPTN